jgi:transketolase N-terminal domain/subunit
VSTTATDTELEQRAINVIRGLCMDGPEAAKNGHPGTGMALAPLAHVLWTRIMKYDASYIDWPDRDRFVLSNGHASILLYSMLCLTGIGDLTLEDVKQFRQWGSKTPGHPEVHHTKGVEVTTGPLGQGFANGVGMGIAERYLRSRFSPDACDHHTFVIAGDGCLEEGVSHEAGSLAGHLKLGRLVYIYDDNHITIDGDTALSYSDDAGKRFEAYGWHVENLGEAANDLNALESALRRAMADDDAPSMRSASRRRSSACRRASRSTFPTTSSRTTAKQACEADRSARSGRSGSRHSTSITRRGTRASKDAGSTAGSRSCRRGASARRSPPASRAAHACRRSSTWYPASWPAAPISPATRGP